MGLDKSNGYEGIARNFISARNARIGPAVVREWSRMLPPGASILDLGCGHGEPISRTLIEGGFHLFGVDASATLTAVFRETFPDSPCECSAVEDSTFFDRAFDAVIAWGLMFLLPADVQALVIGRVAKVLLPGGNFLFTAPKEAVTWRDSLTDRECVSLGLPAFRRLLEAEGLQLFGERTDEGENYYYLISRPSQDGAEEGNPPEHHGAERE